MNQIVVAPEVLERFHELAADRRYVTILAERIAAAERGEFASDETVEQFFAEHAE